MKRWNPGNLAALGILYTGAAAIRTKRRIQDAATDVKKGFLEGLEKADDILPPIQKPQATRNKK